MAGEGGHLINCLAGRCNYLRGPARPEKKGDDYLLRGVTGDPLFFSLQKRRKVQKKEKNLLY